MTLWIENSEVVRYDLYDDLIVDLLTQKYHGKRVIHPFRNCTIPVVCDDFVDREFGSGKI